MFDCLLPCLPRARERRLQHREAELDVRERRLQELEAAERRYQALAAPDGQAVLAYELARALFNVGLVCLAFSPGFVYFG